LADEYLVERGFEVRSPRDADRRGSHVALAHPEARAVGQALIHEESVVPDHRPPDLLRFGFAPLYIRFADVDEAVAHGAGGGLRWCRPVAGDRPGRPLTGQVRGSTDQVGYRDHRVARRASILWLSAMVFSVGGPIYRACSVG